jgi:hypothetical protein
VGCTGRPPNDAGTIAPAVTFTLVICSSEPGFERYADVRPRWTDADAATD